MARRSRSNVAGSAGGGTPRRRVSICVPSRNRQKYFQQTITDLLSNPRDDVEFVFSDNSDDPSVMTDFMAGVHDCRMRFLPAGPVALSMRDNVERCIANARGDFVCVIGDDDYVTPDIADLLTHIQVQMPEVEAIAWRRVYYRWPDFRPNQGAIAVDLGRTWGRVQRAELFDEYFRWSNHQLTASVPYTVFHCLIARELLEKIKRRFGGRYFEHQTVDVDNCCKILVTAKHFAFTHRPYSIDGACAASNTANSFDVEKYARIQAEHARLSDHDANADPDMQIFPFPSTLGISASGAQAQRWFKRTYGVEWANWEGNFARACARECDFARNRETYDAMVASYRQAFELWQNGAFIDHFHPKPYSVPSGPILHVSDFRINVLCVSEDVAEITTPKGLYEIIDQITVSTNDIGYAGVLRITEHHTSEPGHPATFASLESSQRESYGDR